MATAETTTTAVLADLEACGALKRGHFLLSSGLHSPAYVQCALYLESPSRAGEAGAALAVRLRGERIDSVLSPALGGVVIGHEVARALGVPFRFCEREGEKMALRRGFEIAAGERVAVIEDVGIGAPEAQPRPGARAATQDHADRGRTGQVDEQPTGRLRPT